MKVSIIIPTYNAGSSFQGLLEALKAQSTEAFELIIIDSSSSDGTADIARKFTENVIVIPQAEFDHGGTRTKAARIATGDVLVFLTQDALPYNDKSIAKIIEPFSDGKVAAAYGRQLSYHDTNAFGKHLRMFNYPDKSYKRDKSDIPQYGIKTAFLSDSFAAYRKNALADIGWFKESLILGEDSYAGAKMILKGYSLAYAGDAKVFHSHSYTSFQEFKRYFDIGVFHTCESWILEHFGKAEGEGLKYIRSEVLYLINHGLWYLLPELLFRNVMKFTGYKLGRNYKKLPLSLIVKVSMHHRWWTMMKKSET